MVLLEAVVAGLPVLTTDNCGYAYHISLAGAGRVLPTPFEQSLLDQALADMLSSAQRPRWREQGIRYGRTHDLYSMPEVAAELILGGGQS
jgi:UDP-glucose:(heptosyl)LPS alpha-1,3-glucosyltransferase